MPYPNEWSCRLEDPKNCSAFRRVNQARRHKGKPYDVIYCKVGKKWVQQAFRYPKTHWTKSEALAHCKSHGGHFGEARLLEVKLGPLETN